MEQPLVSIVIPSYNDGEFLPDAIASAAPCRAAGHEVIVVDDGSTDLHTLQVLDQIRRDGIQVLQQEQAGPGVARNTAIAAARGEFILPLDSDNKIESALIDRALEVFARHPRVGVVYSDLYLFGNASGVHRVGPFDLKAMYFANKVDNCAVFRRAVWEEQGGYDAAIRLLGDWDFWLSVAKRGWEFHYIPEPLFHYRVRHGSISADYKFAEKMRRGVRQIYRKHVTDPEIIADALTERLIERVQLEDRLRMLGHWINRWRGSWWTRLGRKLGLVPDLRARVEVQPGYELSLERPDALAPLLVTVEVRGRCQRKDRKLIRGMRIRTGTGEWALTCTPLPAETTVSEFHGWALAPPVGGFWQMEAQREDGEWEFCARVALPSK